MGKKKQKVVLPPELPPDVPDDEIEVSDEDLEFVHKNRDYAGFVANLDTQSITRHVNRVADAKEDDVEIRYEKQLQKNKSLTSSDNVQHEVDLVDALPVKTLDGQVYYRKTGSNQSKNADVEDETVGENEDAGRDNGVVKLTKAEKRAKQKKLRKEAKKQGKEVTEVEAEQTSQAQVLAEVEKELTAEETNENKKRRLAEIGTSMLEDPEGNIKFLKEMLQICKDGDHYILDLGLKSLLAVFKDIIPGNRIRLPTDKELAMVVSKEVKKTRFYESTLLTVYKAYLQKLMSLEKVSSFKRVAIRCICTLLDANPRFNFRDSLLKTVIKNISSTDDVIRKRCCDTIKSLFTNEGKHGGEVTVEAVRLIASLVKDNDCHLHPDSVEVFMSLSFDEDLRKPEPSKADNKKVKKKFYKTGRRNMEIKQDDKKKSKQEMLSKTREEVKADYMAAAFAQDIEEKRKIQSDTLSSVFETYFRILKYTLHSGSEASESITGPFGDHPLLAPCLNGIGKFSHLIDMDFMADLMKYLRKLAGGSDDLKNPSTSGSSHLTVTERLRCCIVAFKVMKNNLDALNVDLQDFFIQLYNLILEYRPGRDQGEVLAEALKIMLCDDRQHDMQRAAAFIKRLASFSLCFGAAESMAALVTLKHLLQKNVKCRDLLENDSGGGSLSGSIAKYQPYASDPNLSGAFATVLWELTVLSKHYHPSVSTMASGISNMTNANNQVYIANISPQQAFSDMSLDKEKITLKTAQKQSNSKRKRGNRPLAATGGADKEVMLDENVVRNKLSEHFSLVNEMEENERLRRELDRTTLAVQLYNQYKKQKKRRTK